MRPMALSEAILARAAGRAKVEAGDLVTCRVDRILATDITAPLSIKVFRDMGGNHVSNPSACVLVNDHFVPAKDITSANLSKAMRDFAAEQGIAGYFEVGRSGICHALVAERCLVNPGELMVGADSHTCTAGALGAFATGVGSTDLAAAWALGELWFRVPETVKVVLDGEASGGVEAKDIILKILSTLGAEGARYMAIEFHGGAVGAMEMEARLTLCNMAVEAGAKAGIVPPDDVTEKYVLERGGSMSKARESDPGAHFSRTLSMDISSLEPLVAEPFSPCNARPAREFSDVKVDQVFIGSCTNGYLADLRSAAAVLKGRRAAEGVRLVVTPATQDIYLSAVKEGIAETLIEAGAALTTPTCGACLGGHMGVLGEGETAIATTNRNFRGRMGALTSKVYLSNASVAAASAVTGRITLPGELP